MTKLLPHRSFWVWGVWAAIPLAASAPPDNPQVDKQVEQITRGPEYDWLRAPRTTGQESAGGSSEVTPADALEKERKARQGDACGYKPTPAQERGRRERMKGEGNACGVESPGAPSRRSEPKDLSSGCCSRKGGSGCSCNGPSSCGEGPSLGACGCGAVGSGLGYVLGGLGLAAIVFIIVWFIARRDKRHSETVIESAREVSAPEEVSLSEVPETPFNQMMRRALTAADAGDFRRAVGFAYLAGIGSLHRASKINLQVSTTNWEIVEMTRRSKGPHRAVARVIRIFEDLFFGGREADFQQWQECRDLVQGELKLEEPGND